MSEHLKASRHRAAFGYYGEAAESFAVFDACLIEQELQRVERELTALRASQERLAQANDLLYLEAEALRKELAETNEHKDDWMGRHYAQYSEVTKLRAENAALRADKARLLRKYHVAFNALVKINKMGVAGSFANEAILDCIDAAAGFKPSNDGQGQSLRNP